MIRLEKIDHEKIEYMPRYFANGMVEGYYKADFNRIVVLLKQEISPNSLRDLHHLCYNFTEYCRDKEVMDFVLRHFNLPLKWIDEKGVYGIEIQPYPSEYYFLDGKFRNHIKEGKWFCSEKLRNKFLLPSQRGNTLTLLLCVKDIISLNYLFQDAGLVIDDLSCATCLVNPDLGNSFFVAWDGVHKYDENPNHIKPTPGFLSPEQIAQSNIYRFPTYYSNNHALAVLLYQLLLHRHPLRGKKIFDDNPSRDEELRLGEKALFIEHPGDKSNEVNVKELMDSEIPYGNPNIRPYTLLGPFLARLINLAFVEALHIPHSRPNPKDWLVAIDKTQYTLIPCSNPTCEEKYYVFQEAHKGVCPYCKSKVKGNFPVFNSYSKTGEGKYRYDEFRIIGRNGMVISRHLLYSDKCEDPLSIINAKNGLSIENEDNNWFLSNHCNESVMIVKSQMKIILSFNEKILIEDGMQIVIMGSAGKLFLVQWLNYK